MSGRSLPLALVFGSAIPLSSAFFGAPAFPMWADNLFATPCCWLRPTSVHMAVSRELDRHDGRNLVIVDTGPRWPRSEAVIANDADIDASKTIWVNEDPELDRSTIDRYPGRRIWRLSWLDGIGPCLQLMQTVTAVVGSPVLGGFAILDGDPERGWFPAPPGQCPGGLTRDPRTIIAALERSAAVVHAE